MNLLIVKKTLSGVIDNRLSGLAAEIAFHSMLALFPAILAACTAIGFWGESIKYNLLYLMFQLNSIIPEQVGKILLDFIQEIQVTNSSWFSLSFIASFWAASVGMTTRLDALDVIHQVSRKQKRPFWEKKLISIILTIVTFILVVLASFLAFFSDFILIFAIKQNWILLFLIVWKILTSLLLILVLLASLAITHKIQQNKLQNLIKKISYICLVVLGAVLAISLLLDSLKFVYIYLDLSKVNEKIISLFLGLWRISIIPLTWLIVAVNFAFVYRFGCSKRKQNIPIFPGAIISSLSWIIACNLFRIYIYYAQYNRVYGTIGAVIVLMLWLYLNALFFLIGEQINVVIGEGDINGQ